MRSRPSYVLAVGVFTRLPCGRVLYRLNVCGRPNVGVADNWREALGIVACNANVGGALREAVADA